MTPMEIPALDAVDAWSGGAILPPGWHEVSVNQVNETKSTNGHPQAEIRMDSPEGSITDWVTVTSESLGRVKQVLLAFGIEIPAGKFGMDWSQLVGRQVRVFVREEPKNDGSGQTRTKVKAYEPSRGGAGASSGMPGASREGDDLPF